MKYKLIQKTNPRKLESRRKWYASLIKKGTVSNNHLYKRVATKSSIARPIVTTVIDSVAKEIPCYLMEGYSVNLNNLGTLRISLSNEGADTPEEFTHANIKNVRVIFTPSPSFKRALQNIQFEKVDGEYEDETVPVEEIVAI